MKVKRWRQFPVISLAAEHLVVGSLMRRNILAYKAPPRNAGYDLICIHPDPTKSGEQIRVQVKSRYQTDCDRAFPVKEKSFDSFDYLIIVFLNNGFYYKKNQAILNGYREPEFYTLPTEFIRDNHYKTPSGWEKVLTKNLEMENFKNEKGFEIIAKDLGIPYPGEEYDS